MATLGYRIGDATQPHGEPPWVIAHCCNDAGLWGAGFSGAVSRRWPRVRDSYIRWYFSDETRNRGDSADTPFDLGHVQFAFAQTDVYVANIIGQHGTLSENNPTPIRYDALAHGLSLVGIWAKDRGASVHMPRIGAGLAGGDWFVIEPMINQYIVGIGVPVTVYTLPNGSSA